MNIVIERGKVVDIETLPEFSIALDGYVQGPRIDSKHKRYSFDHHGDCIRFCTTSACMQTWTAILLGLNPQDYTVFANDIDADVCVSVWCLKNPERCTEPLVKKLVNAVGIGDMHGGALTSNGMTKTVEWISAPETDSKRNNDYHKLSNDGLGTIMESVLHRIDMYVNGEASAEIAKQAKHGEYKILRNENNWVLAESQDPHALSSLYQGGFDRILLTRPQEDGSIAVTIAKKSDFISSFPITKMYDELNKLEDGWGGSSIIGGAPRNDDGSRTRLSLDKICEIVDNCVLNKKVQSVTKRSKKTRSKKS